MNLTEYFKTKHNDPQVIKNEGLNEFRFSKVIDVLGEQCGLFYGEIDTGLFPHFTKHIYHIDKDGYEVIESQKTECLDGMWVNYGKPQLKRLRKIF